MEQVIARRDVAVIGGAFGAGIHPIRFQPFEPVLNLTFSGATKLNPV